MRKVFKLDEIDCANCAQKLEDAINRVEGVEQARVNFMTQKLTLTTSDDANFDDVLDRARPRGEAHRRHRARLRDPAVTRVCTHLPRGRPPAATSRLVV